MQCRLAGRGEEGECVTLLLLEGGGHGEDALDEAAAPLAVGAEADLAPDDGVAESALGLVVRGLDAVGVDEGEEGRLVLQDVLGHSTGASGWRVVAPAREPTGAGRRWPIPW